MKIHSFFIELYSRLRGSTIEKLPASGLTGEAYLFTAVVVVAALIGSVIIFFSGPATVTIEARHIKYALCVCVYSKHSRYMVLVLWWRQLLLFAIICRHTQTHTSKTHTYCALVFVNSFMKYVERAAGKRVREHTHAHLLFGV